MTQFHEYPKWLHFAGEASVLVNDGDEEASVLESRAAAPEHVELSSDDTEKAAIRARLTELGAPPPHHKAGLDKLRALLADAEALAEGAKDPEPEPEPAPSDEPDAQ